MQVTRFEVLRVQPSPASAEADGVTLENQEQLANECRAVPKKERERPEQLPNSQPGSRRPGALGPPR